MSGVTNETQVEVTQADLESKGWVWLEEMVESICDEHVSDIAYSANQMVDAFVAGSHHRIEAEKRASPRQVVEIDWDEIRQTVESACDDSDADLQWAVDIVRDELGGQLASLTTQNNALAGSQYEKRTANRDVVEALEQYREALTPSGDTKAAYFGEFKFNVEIENVDFEEDEDESDHNPRTHMMPVYVPWTTVKEIMAAISARALGEAGE